MSKPREPGRRKVSLAFSGGTALGAYAAGAYEGFQDAGLQADLVSGASIGAITAAIVAGNPPARRVARLREFWKQAAAGSAFALPAPARGRLRELHNKAHALQTVLGGRPGMFTPRVSGLWSLLPWMPGDNGLFDPEPIVSTLERLIDFDLLNRAATPMVVSCVDLESGDPVYFDSRRERIGPRHLLASTAFIPGFPPIEIGGRCLGDPGMLCNLPLDPVLDPRSSVDQLCFAIDLFDVRGQVPRSLDVGLERAQDITFAGPSLRTIEAHRREHGLRRLLGRVGAERAGRSHAGPATREALQAQCTGSAEVVLLAYRAPAHEVGTKAIDFSSASIADRWRSDREDMESALARLDAGAATLREDGYAFYDGRRPADAEAEKA